MMHLHFMARDTDSGNIINAKALRQSHAFDANTIPRAPDAIDAVVALDSDTAASMNAGTDLDKGPEVLNAR